MKQKVHYREISDYNEYPTIEEIQVDAWNFPEREIVPRRLFYATRKSGGVVIGAFLGETMIGYCWGWVGYKKEFGRFIYSHHNAVRREYQNKGIGYNLKKAQREWAIKNDYSLINWTFDPLQSRNCYLNLHKLGVICNTYYENYWGMMNDDLNRGIETDRLYCNWIINSNEVNKRINCEFDDYREKIKDKSRRVIEVDSSKELIIPAKIHLDKDENELFVQIPYNFNYLIKNEKENLKEWRMKIRTVFQKYFSKGYFIVDFIIDEDQLITNCYHVLKKMKTKVLNNENRKD